jgi:hypothetical protein
MFECLNDNYKKIWLEYKYQLVSKAKKLNCKNFSSSFSEILDDLAIFKILNYRDKTGVVYEDYKSYLKTLEISSEVSGNLDARKIRELSESYGFSVPEKCDELLIIKNFRNHLAHGEKTFSEIGKEKSITELIRINVRVTLYLRAVLKSISDFINNKHYLKHTD